MGFAAAAAAADIVDFAVLVDGVAAAVFLVVVVVVVVLAIDVCGWPPGVLSLTLRCPAFPQVCAGTQPGECDVAEAVNVTSPQNATGDAIGVTGEVPYPTHLDTYTHDFTALTLAQGATYFITVTLVDTIGRRVTASSDGVSVDFSPPVAGTVVDGRRSEGADRDFQATSKMFVWWTGFADPDSGIERYLAALSTTADPESVPAAEWYEVYGGTMATFDQIHPDGTVLYAHVRVRCAAATPQLRALLWGRCGSVFFGFLVPSKTAQGQWRLECGWAAVGEDFWA